MHALRTRLRAVVIIVVSNSPIPRQLLNLSTCGILKLIGGHYFIW